MAKLHQIVAQINTELAQAGGQFDSKRFQKGRFSGIAELITKPDGDTRQTIPAIISNNDVDTILTVDDRFSFELYHRHIGSTVAEVEQDFGDRRVREETAEMLLVIIGERDKIKFNKEEIITGLLLGIPLEMTKSFLITNKLTNVNIIPGTLNLDREELWNSEYNTEVMLKPNQIFFSMNYQIVTQTWTSCIEICQ